MVTFFNLIEKRGKYFKNFNFEKKNCVHGFGKSAERIFMKFAQKLHHTLAEGGKEYLVNRLKFQTRK